MYLANAPLELVLCQVRWPALGSLQTEDQLRPVAVMFGEAIAGYPLFSEARNVNYLITPDGITSTDAGSVYQWGSVDDVWHISLARQFMTVYCTQYDGYESFDAQLRIALDALSTHVHVPLVDRIGVRYINRISRQEDMDDLPSLLSPEVLGYQAIDVVQPGPSLVSSTNQVTYQVDDALLQVRSGVFPPGQSVDPAIRVLPTDSWVLDLESSREGRQLLDVDAVALTASRMSDIAYDYFRLIVTSRFMDRYSERGTDNGRS